MAKIAYDYIFHPKDVNDLLRKYFLHLQFLMKFEELLCYEQNLYDEVGGDNTMLLIQWEKM